MTISEQLTQRGFYFCNNRLVHIQENGFVDWYKESDLERVITEYLGEYDDSVEITLPTMEENELIKYFLKDE